MTSHITQIADAVVAELNAGDFGMEFTAERSYLPRFELPEMSDLRITVVPAGIEVVTSGRSRTTQRCTIDVGVQKKLSVNGDGENGEVDALVELAQQVADFFRLRRLSGYAQAVWIKTEHAPLYDPAHMEQLRQFTAVVRLTYQVTR